MTLRVSSYDWDACLAGRDSGFGSLISNNKDLLDTQNADLVMLFSGRQSQMFDASNAWSNCNGSAFLGMPIITEYLKKPFLPVLMGDLRHVHMVVGEPMTVGSPLGTEISKGISGSDDKLDDSLAAISNSGKQALAYYQAQFLANMFPNEENIELTLYDDRADLLKGVYTYFEKYPELLPSNVTLKLIQREQVSSIVPAPTIKERYTIKGTGFIDAAFMQTTRDMTENTTGYHGSGCEPFRLCNRIAKIAPVLGSPQDKQEKIAVELRDFCKEFINLRRTLKLEYGGSPEERDTSQLIYYLLCAITTYYVYPSDVNRAVFIAVCTKYINIYKEAQPANAPAFIKMEAALACLGQDLATKVADLRQQTLDLVLQRSVTHLEMELDQLATMQVDTSFKMLHEALCSNLRLALDNYLTSAKTEEDKQRLKEHCVKALGLSNTLKCEQGFSPLFHSILLTLSSIGSDNSLLLERYNTVVASCSEIGVHNLVSSYNRLRRGAQDLDPVNAKKVNALVDNLEAYGDMLQSREFFIQHCIRVITDAKAYLPIPLFKVEARTILTTLLWLAPDAESVKDIKACQASIGILCVKEESVAAFNKALLQLENWGNTLDVTPSQACRRLKEALFTAAETYYKSNDTDRDKQQFIRSFRAATRQANTTLMPYSRFQFILYNLIVAASMLIGVGVAVFINNKRTTGKWLGFYGNPEQTRAVNNIATTCVSLIANTTLDESKHDYPANLF